MKVTSDGLILVTIEGIDGDDLISFMNMVRGAALQERRVWFPVLSAIEKTTLNELPLSSALVLAQEVRKMRTLQEKCNKTLALGDLRTLNAQEAKVDKMVNDILNKL